MRDGALCGNVVGLVLVVTVALVLAVGGFWGWRQAFDSVVPAAGNHRPSANVETVVPAGYEVGAAPRMPARLTRMPVDGGALAGVGFDGIGLWQLDVDGQTFLMVVTRNGVGLSPYEPVRPEGADQ